ncbi:COP23 domain-containing protein [Roseofilum sp. BLCC_M91]|uniref:COP23 domain-containing protein n=1 Tax=Roseofilum halophilum BLCC-M91 TaxID=3022259 RepID=A0ABT7BGI8_9CYAN|nr:COP23 domain-containing protein [Roseofilum halophilum]MDJ1178303.1 COP23 domain-containing protein [Roseofilum halophilum BLCC-M91]
MKFKFNRSNWFSRVLMGTAILATLGVMVPEVVNANGAESQDTLAVYPRLSAQELAEHRRKQIEELVKEIEKTQAEMNANPQQFCQQENGQKCAVLSNQLQVTAGLFYSMGEALQEQNNPQQAQRQFEKAGSFTEQANRIQSLTRGIQSGYYTEGTGGSYPGLDENLVSYQEAEKSDLQQEATGFFQQGENQLAYQSIGQVSKVGKHFDCRQNNGQWQTVVNKNSQSHPLILWGDLGGYSTEARCNAVSARLNNLESHVVQDVAQTFKVDEIEVDQKKVTVVCVPDRGRCNSENAIFTLTRASRPSNWEIQEQFIGLVNDPGSEAPIRN